MEVLRSELIELQKSEEIPPIEIKKEQLETKMEVPPKN